MPGLLNDYNRAFEILYGLLKGIVSDKEISIEELNKLQEWLTIHRNLSHRLPFCEIYEMIERITEDGIIDQYEHEEIMEYCKNIELLESPYENLTQEMRILHGFIQGICADIIIKPEELKALEKWILYHKDISEKWPFNEVYELCERILKDGVISDDEAKAFLSFASQFRESGINKVAFDPSIFTNNWMYTAAPVVDTITSILDKDVVIDIEGKTICITGIMKVRRGFAHDMIIERGGLIKKAVTRDLNYLVIGAASNPCWKYSTYGGKIEKAMEYKKQGMTISIVHEDNFLLALNS